MSLKGGGRTSTSAAAKCSRSRRAAFGRPRHASGLAWDEETGRLWEQRKATRADELGAVVGDVVGARSRAGRREKCRRYGWAECDGMRHEVLDIACCAAKLNRAVK